MVFWLILVLSGGVPLQGVGGTPSYPSGMHVGNFSTLEACEAAAKEAKLVPVRPNGLVVVSGFVCVRANQGVAPPA
jgi:hypothetical protein